MRWRDAARGRVLVVMLGSHKLRQAGANPKFFVCCPPHLFVDSLNSRSFVSLCLGLGSLCACLLVSLCAPFGLGHLGHSRELR